MATRCKFTCMAVKKMHNRNPDRFLYEAEFSAVYGDSEENKKFFEWTPSGSLRVGIYKEDVFMPGKDYYIDIFEAT